MKTWNIDIFYRGKNLIGFDELGIDLTPYVIYYYGSLPSIHYDLMSVMVF